MASPIRCASASSSGSRIVAMNALRSAATRSAGTPGAHHVGTAERFRRIDQLHDLAVLRRGGEIDRERHAHPVDLGIALVVLLHEHADEAGFDPVRALRVQARPGEAAQSLDLVLLDRERDLARAGIAADLADLRAGRVVEHGRIVARRGAGLARRRSSIPGRAASLERLDRRVGAHDADVMVGGGGADLDQLGGVVPQPPVLPSTVSNSASMMALFCGAPITVPSLGATL